MKYVWAAKLYVYVSVCVKCMQHVFRLRMHKFMYLTMSTALKEVRGYFSIWWLSFRVYRFVLSNRFYIRAFKPIHAHTCIYIYICIVVIYPFWISIHTLVRIRTKKKHPLKYCLYPLASNYMYIVQLTLCEPWAYTNWIKYFIYCVSCVAFASGPAAHFLLIENERHWVNEWVSEIPLLSLLAIFYGRM